jgi:hypothetical protein
MAGTTFSARQTARDASKASGRPVTDKRVRAWARESIARFDDDGYTAHVYTVAEHKAIVAAFVAKAKGTVGTNARARSASNGRRGTSPAPKRQRGTGTTPKQTMAGDTPDA